jgi:high-affinity iron transporter
LSDDHPGVRTLLPTFVIGLREGLEAALIVGIIAAFLNKQGRSDLLRWVFGGIAAATALCVAAGVALNQLSKGLPQKQQEGLETVIAALAVAMVSYMVIWMKRNSRELKGQLEALTADAMGARSGAARALVFMAFLAVLREGLETVVFLLAAFQESGSGHAGLGAALGIVIAIALGYGIYRGGVRINLSRFFRFTGLVLVLVAAGLVANALHTAHEAGWLEFGQGTTVDLTWLVRPGSVRSSLLTGILGLQGHPVTIEVIGWALYAVPATCYVAWPAGRRFPRRRAAVVLAALGATAAAVAAILVLTIPTIPAPAPVTSAEGWSAQVVSTPLGGPPSIRTQTRNPAAGGDQAGGLAEIVMSPAGTETHGSVATRKYTADATGSAAATLPQQLSLERLAQLNGGRLPLGTAIGGSDLPVHYQDAVHLEVWVQPTTDRVVDLAWTESVAAALVRPDGSTAPLAQPAATGTARLPTAAAQAAERAAAADLDRIASRTRHQHAAETLLVLAALALAGFAYLHLIPRPSRARKPLTRPSDVARASVARPRTAYEHSVQELP